jgi:acyl-CoA thioester hydrolase
MAAPPSPLPSLGVTADPLLSGGWCLRRRVLPQHTDHAGVMWHGAYLAWLEEARVEALAAVGLAYSDLSGRGLELPVVSLAIEYRQALLHGAAVEIRSAVGPRRGVRLPWRSLLLDGDRRVAAEARVELVAVAMEGPGRRRLLRRLPSDLDRALAALAEGPG